MGQQQGKDNTSQPSETSEDVPPYIPECEIFEEGDPEAGDKLMNCARQCKKEFIPVKDFTRDHLQEKYRGRWEWEEFQNLFLRTVKLKVSYTSLHRPLTHPDSTAPYPYCRHRGLDTVNRTGTGYIMAFNKEQPWMEKEICPCPECKGRESEQAKNGCFHVFVMTAPHVVFDNGEAEKTVCEVFDDDPDNRDKVRYLYGVKGVDRESLERIEGDGAFVRDAYDRLDMGNINIENRLRHNMFVMECVSHDWMLYKELQSVLRGWDDRVTDIPIIASHPHGASKMVSVGTTLALRIPLPKTRTPGTPYYIKVNASVWTEIDLVTRYLGFFKKDPITDTRYETTKPLHLYFPCDESNTATFRCNEDPDGGYLLPEGSSLTSVDGGTDIPGDGIGFSARRLFRILDHKDRSHYFVYDIHTCKGSSGARVQTKGDLALSCHFGKVVGGSGLNRTGMNMC